MMLRLVSSLFLVVSAWASAEEPAANARAAKIATVPANATAAGLTPEPPTLRRMTVIQWLGGVGAAISIKLSSSIDDVVWLAPFLTSNVSNGQRVTNTAIYITVCLVQTAIALVIAYSGNKVVHYLTSGAKGIWTTEKILTVFACSLLAIYSVKLTYEYFTEEDEDSTEEDKNDANKYQKPSHQETEGDPNARQLSSRKRQVEIEHAVDLEAGGAPRQTQGGGPPSARNIQRGETEAAAGGVPPPVDIQGMKDNGSTGPGGERRPSARLLIGSLEVEPGNPQNATGGAAPAPERREKTEKNQSMTLFVIAFVGSVDDLTLFVPMLVGKGFDIVQLITGGFIAASTIVLLCIFLGLCKPVSDFLAKIPLALIVICFAIFLGIKACIME